uniref:BRO1 domain-containing protein n=1 Tax=Steinernema glaseri TaxID=37863 RepID=A0A1I7ZGC7_9BILA
MSWTFLAVPLKTTNEVDLVKPLKSYVDSIYQTNDDVSTEITEAICELNKLRNRACNQPLDKHQSGLDIITRYYDQLVAIENKIPISATVNPIAFKWKDAFDKGTAFFRKASSLTSHDSSFERACVLFNCAALMSAIAASQSVVNDEELKTAAKMFQQAAGIFLRLKETVLGLVQQDPTSDLLPDTLSALSALMVAQAQEAIYHKASKDKMKETALVKIAAQCAELYQEAYKLMTREIVKGVWEKEWLNAVNAKGLALCALAQYHQANVNADSKDIGEQLSRLTEAMRLMELTGNYVPSSTFTAHQKAIEKAHAGAKKDNDFIYHERVADFRSLPALPKAALAKPITPGDYLSPRFKDMFSSLVPVQIQSSLSTFESRRSDIINCETSSLREYTQIMNTQLASLNLPAALDDVTNQEKLPESIRQKSSKVKSDGGVIALTSIMSELPEACKRNDEILNETSRLLKDENDTDQNLRTQFQEKWTRMASSALTGPLTQEIGKYRGILHTASNADNIVRTKFEQHRQGFELLSKTEAELQAAIPGLDNTSTNTGSASVQELRRLMQEVQKIKDTREDIEKKLKSVNFDMTKTFLEALNDNAVINEEELSKAKLEELFGPLKAAVAKSIEQQETIMTKVRDTNARFVQEKSGGAGGLERENILKTLASAYDAYSELQSNLKEGLKFYNDLTPLLVRLQQKVSDFCFARQTEKEDLMRQVQQNIVSGVGGSSNKATPPPRPPPPRADSTNSVEPPIAPPRNIQPQQASAPAPAAQHPQTQQGAPYQPLNYSQSPFATLPNQMQPNPYMPYAQPQMFQNPFQPQFGQNYTTPYPVNYPTTYPGAGYAQQPMFTPQPQMGQQQQQQMPYPQQYNPFPQQQQPPQ